MHFLHSGIVQTGIVQMQHWFI
ncbi:hypothetical protein ISM_07090 [Roseovarius nubinhibens ISM]|uniref:Uncharacterized protein n=1 Tax=Roseovarius nubinhibens (strain ATCC BAA-591 / DSM 15170 / ISM) TaxID=89187 RepID=A3SL10_ROSNI|nr:hypothetical protein ISM_07090 [Roseovarius nubinhibens ISM]